MDAARFAHAGPEQTIEQELLDLGFDAIMVRDFETRRIVAWNRAAETLYGFRDDEALGRIPGELLGTVYPMPLDDIEAHLLRHGRWEGMLRQFSKSGEELVVNGRWALRLTAGGRPAILEVNADITGEHQAESRLRAAEERFRILIGGVRDYAIFMLDPGGIISSWNEGARRISGYTADEIIGRHFTVFYPPCVAATGRPQRALQAALRDGRYEEEGWRIRRDGTRYWANVVITALFDDEGNPRGFAKVTRDGTDRKRDAARLRWLQRRELQKLRQHAAEAAKLDQTKSEFLRLASHELRGPITVVRGYLDMLREGSFGVLPPGSGMIIDMVVAKMSEINGLVDQLLDVARLEEARLELHPEPIDLRAIVKDAFDQVSTVATPMHDLVLDMDERAVVATVDADRFRRVAYNLLDNAVKYSPQGGEVACRLHAEDGLARLRISDEGIGIDATDLPRLFTRFGRLVTSTNSHIPGTGLGLYLTRELVRRFGGDITVAARERGTEFTVELPLALRQV